MVSALNNLISLFQVILVMSACAALLCGVILLMKAVAGRRMSARSHALTWLVLIPALLVPFSLIPLPAGGWTARSAEVWTSVRQMVGQLAAEPIATLPEEEKNLNTTSTVSIADSNETISRNQTSGSSNIVNLKVSLTTGQTIWLILSLVWLIGLLLFLVTYIFSYQKTRRMSRVTVNPAMNYWHERLLLLTGENGLRKSEHVQLRQMDSNRSPFVIGLHRCSIMLPPCLLDQTDTNLVDSILIHELIHIKHRDHWLRLLQCLLLCIHWFNPLCWLAFRLQQRDCEFYCDEAAVRQLKDHDRTAYAQALLATTVCWTKAKEPPPAERLLTASFAENNLRDRITRVLRKRQTSAIMAAAVLLVILFGFSLLPGLTGTPKDNHSSSKASQTTSEPSPATSEPSPTGSEPLQIFAKYTGSGGAVTIPEGFTSIGEFAFNSCNSVTSITLPNSLRSIGKAAFQSCNGLKSITIPDGLTSIGEWAFFNCSKLTLITIPDSVISIGEGAFSGTFISNPIIINGGKRLCYVPYAYLTYTIPSTVTTIGAGAFSTYSDYGYLASITIPESVTSIEKNAFYACVRLASITIPDSVTSIGEKALAGCSSLTLITIPKSVTSIEQGTFSYCENLTSITIPDSVTSIGEEAFSSCNKLVSITIPDSVMSIGDNAFSDCKNLTLHVNDGSFAQRYAVSTGIPFVID